MLIKQLRKNNESYNQISYLILANEPNITDDQTPYRNGFTKKKYDTTCPCGLIPGYHT